MRRLRFFSAVIVVFFLNLSSLHAQQSVIDRINGYGTFDRWSVREFRESDLIGGRTKFLYEFYGSGDTVVTREPLVKPADYLWRTNNVIANVKGINKANVTVFPERRGSGWCARIETHTEDVTVFGVINMKVVCQGGMLIGDIVEPIRNTSDPMGKVLFGVPFKGRPSRLVYDRKADVGHATVRGTGFSSLKTLDYPDYPEVCIILQKRWEDADGNVRALRVGTGYELVTENIPEWENGHVLDIRYGDISSDSSYRDFMALQKDPAKVFHTINSKGKNVPVYEEGWADADTEPNFIVVKFLSSCHQAFYGGVGNILWIDNVRIEM